MLELNRKTAGTNWVNIELEGLYLLRAQQPKNVIETGEAFVLLSQGGITHRMNIETKKLFSEFVKQFLPPKATGKLKLHYQDGYLKTISFDNK